MTSDIDVHIGARIRFRRRLLGLSQSVLARAIGVRFQQIQKYECAANTVSAGRLWALAVQLGVGMDYFFDGLPRDVASVIASRSERLEPAMAATL